MKSITLYPACWRRCSSRVVLLCMAFLAPFLPAMPAHADDPTPDAIDASIDKLIQLDPVQVATALKGYSAQAAAWESESAALKHQADELEQKSKAILARLDQIKERALALSKAFGEPVQGTQMAQAAPAMSPAPEMAPAADTSAETKPKVTYAEHILPILKQKCAKCHNQDTQKGGLTVDSYQAILAGGSSGAVINPGDADSSRLFRLVSGAEEPKMPPSGDGLSEDQLALLKEWIAIGAPVDANAKMAQQENEPKAEMTGFVTAAVVDGPPPMPEVQLAGPIAEYDRRVVARAVATNPRAPLLAVGGFRQVLLYDLTSYALLGALPFPEGEIFALTFSANGELLVAGGGVPGDSGCVVVWNVRSAERAGKYGEEYDAVLAADISPDHRMVALGGSTKKVKVYSVADGSPLYTCEDHTDWIYSVKFSPDGELLSTADRAGGLLLWQAANGRAVESLRGHGGAIHDLSYSADSALLASASADGTVRIWDTWQYKQVRSIAAHGGGVLSVDFSDTGELLSTGVDGLTKRWDSTGKNVATYEQLPDWGYQARFGAQDALVLAGAWNGEICLWDTASGSRVAQVFTGSS